MPTDVRLSWTDKGWLTPLPAKQEAPPSAEPNHEPVPVSPMEILTALQKHPELEHQFLRIVGDNKISRLPIDLTWTQAAPEDFDSQTRGLTDIHRHREIYVTHNLLGRPVGLIRFDPGNQPGMPPWTAWVYDVVQNEWALLDLDWGAQRPEAEDVVERGLHEHGYQRGIPHRWSKASPMSKRCSRCGALFQQTKNPHTEHCSGPPREDTS